MVSKQQSYHQKSFCYSEQGAICTCKVVGTQIKVLLVQNYMSLGCAQEQPDQSVLLEKKKKKAFKIQEIHITIQPIKNPCCKEVARLTDLLFSFTLHALFISSIIKQAFKGAKHKDLDVVDNFFVCLFVFPTNSLLILPGVLQML